ncbi:hypothetical protein QSJ18_18205 [Gordonia sp. ABSL1-1]|uniref:hypothetical protein n=1 Tax=Gordonia sp. ABSL1-1 TaxID=3053923 RepID=UPI0025722D85|nr:hypothetical protein [Gordonia sp. ABSL1-1]MDL9938683.1 hypothetical protein [Gordonia sp. ABSL1-1]
MVATINPDASHIWDEAEVWIQSKASVDAAGGIANVLPATVDDDFAAKGWDYVGLIDAKKGIPVDPSGELKEFDGFGYTSYRQKFSKGKVKTGFTALEDNAVTAGIVLPGSAPDKIGVPKDLQFYVLYRTVDQGFADLARVTLRPATLELKSHSGAVEGEQESYEFVVHHSPDSNKDVFQKIGGAAGVSDYLVTVTAGSGTFPLTFQGNTATIAFDANAAAVKAALAGLDDGFKASQWSVTGTGPFTVTLPVPGVLVGGAGVTVAPA